jgi:hypothetical protein
LWARLGSLGAAAVEVSGVRGVVPELVTNRAVEQVAIVYVIAKERGAGREARDVRGTGSAGDVDSPPRTIEVRAYGRSARGSDLLARSSPG